MKAFADHDVSLAMPIIKHFEGLRLDAYLCPSGVPTIGYGHTQGVKLGDTINLEEANSLLENDLKALQKVMSKVVKVQVTQGEFIALMSFVYNLGIGNFRRSSLLRLLNGGDKKGAAKEFPKWSMANGKVLAGLKKRRVTEERVFLGATIDFSPMD